MPTKNISPKINSIKWGNILIDGDNRYKDAKLYPGGSRAWDWNETGTHHSPGIQPADIEELLEHGADVIILSKGFNERLQTAPETEQYLGHEDIPYHILQTENAVQAYNELRKDHKVGALIHSTC
jgi:hypothetical protein